MRFKTPLGRFGLACAAASVTALAAAAPARAAEPGEFAWVQPSMQFVTNVAMDATKPKPVEVVVENNSPTAAIDVTVKIDTSGVSDAFQLDLPGGDKGCTVAGKVATCTLDGLAANSKHVYTIGALPGDLEVLEYTGVIKVTTSAANMTEDQTTEGTLQLAWPGADLVVDEIDDVTLEPGQAATVPVVAANVGTVTAAGVEVVISVGLDLELPDQYENCTYDADSLALTCQILGDVAPDEVFTIHEDTPLRVKVGEKAPGPTERGVYVHVRPMLEEEVEALSTRKARGNQLRLAAAPVPVEDLNDYDNYTEFLVNIPKQPADSVAIGGTVAGAVGDTVDLKVGMRNDGPADLLSPGEEWSPFAIVTLPAGVKAVTVSDRCQPIVDGEPQWENEGQAIGLVYLCFPTHSPEAGEEFFYPFRVEIVDTAGAAGSIVVEGGVQDPNTDNNTAEITMGAGGGGGLPVTGARAGLVAGVGALLVAAGAVVVVLLRRRRIVTVVE